MNLEILKIFEKAYNNILLSKEECMKLLALEDTSQEALIMRGIASDIIRKKSNNSGTIFAQIGFECHPCPANCKFCSFAKDYTGIPNIKLDDEAIAANTKMFTESNELYGLWLMTMADYDLDDYLRRVEIVKKNIVGPTKILTNVGDTSYEAFCEMKAAGVDGVYHCWRLGEGDVTGILPERRKETAYNAKKAGLEFLDALEPIGTEHTVDELAEHIMWSREMETIQYGAMSRVPVPGTPFENTPMLPAMTLSKIIAAIVLTFAGSKNMPWMGSHEPTTHAFLSGSNMITAESGINPRDTVLDTENNRGWSITKCKSMLKSTGYKYIARADGSRIEL